MGFSLNSSDWGALAGSVANAYSPQAGAAVGSLFNSNPKPVAPPPAVYTAPPPVAQRVPVYAWVAGGVLLVVLVVVIAVKR